jgi:hypothetical protein
MGATGRVILSTFSFDYIRDAAPEFPPAQTEFLGDVLRFFDNPPPNPTVVPSDRPVFANSLEQNYPNPFNPTTLIRYTIRERGHVSLRIYNSAGQVVRTLIDEVQSPYGVSPVLWDGRNDAGQSVASGVYFYKLVTKNFSETKKMALLK